MHPVLPATAAHTGGPPPEVRHSASRRAPASDERHQPPAEVRRWVPDAVLQPNQREDEERKRHDEADHQQRRLNYFAVHCNHLTVVDPSRVSSPARSCTERHRSYPESHAT